MKAFFYTSISEDGWQNLATDEYLLDHVEEDAIILYFYVNKNAVIIGKNQNAWKECNLQAMEQDGVQLVRRISGGGAVYHDEGNLNFSFLMHESHYDLDRQMKVVLNAVKALGISAEFSGRNDILSEGRKFSGNAFAKKGAHCQHHGTLLIHTDLTRLSGYLNVPKQKLKSKGIDSVRSRVMNLADMVQTVTINEVAQALLCAFQQEYGEAKPLVLTPEDVKEISALYEKQSSWDWRIGKTPEFDYEIEHRFAWGNVEFYFSLKNGIVREISVYSDALDTELSDEMKECLLGEKFDANILADALLKIKKPQAIEVSKFLRTAGF